MLHAALLGQSPVECLVYLSKLIHGAPALRKDGIADLAPVFPTNVLSWKSRGQQAYPRPGAGSASQGSAPGSSQSRPAHVRSNLVVMNDDRTGSDPGPVPASTAGEAGGTAHPPGDGAAAALRTAAGRRPVRIVVVEDHALVREGTAELLERDPGLTVVGQASSAEEALKLIGSLRPDVALVDVELPGMSGIALARAAADQIAETRVLILSAYDDYAYVIGALEAGVAGYLLKTSSARELCDAVRTAAGGALVLDEAISRRLTGRWRSGLGTSPALTTRETEVLRLLAQGLPNKQIASHLGLGLRTVESHVSNVLGKLGLSSRTEAALYAVSHHVVPPESRGKQG